MKMLARKISRAKWEPRDYLAEGEIPADAISGCLRTSDDTLSWWRCKGHREDVAEVALALTAAPKIEKFDKIDVVVLPEEVVTDAGLSVETFAGDTLVRELQARHVNLPKLDVDRLVDVAKILAPRIRDGKDGKDVFAFTKKQLMRLVTTAINDKRLDPAELSEKLREKLHKLTADSVRPD